MLTFAIYEEHSGHFNWRSGPKEIFGVVFLINLIP